MKNYNKNNRISTLLAAFAVLAMTIFIVSCDPSIGGFEYDLPEAGSQQDMTPPSANFSANVTDDWMTWNFGNASSNATTYSWDVNGTPYTSTDVTHTFPGEGTYTVSLTASDALGQTETFTRTVTVVEPEEPDVPDPVLLNTDFDKLAKSSGSDCTCAGWINKSVGEQGESSSGNGSDVLKFDNAEPDHIYQEFEVVPNADYNIDLVTQFKPLGSGAFPSQLEIRVLAGTGYNSGYTPMTYGSTTEIPQDGFGYTTLAQIEDPANNLFIQAMSNPGDDSYLPNNFAFNVGANTSVALFIRGIGNTDPPEDPADFERWGFCSGEEEIRLDNIEITAIN